MSREWNESTELTSEADREIGPAVSVAKPVLASYFGMQK
jgi:hypothetical protein